MVSISWHQSVATSSQRLPRLVLFSFASSSLFCVLPPRLSCLRSLKPFGGSHPLTFGLVVVVAGQQHVLESPQAAPEVRSRSVHFPPLDFAVDRSDCISSFLLCALCRTLQAMTTKSFVASGKARTVRSPLRYTSHQGERWQSRRFCPSNTHSFAYVRFAS